MTRAPLPPTEPFLTAGVLADRLGLSRETIRTMTIEGVLRAYTPNKRRLYLESEAREAIQSRVFNPVVDWRAAAEAAGKRAMANRFGARGAGGRRA